MDYQKHKYGIILLKTRYIKQIKFVKFEMVMKKKKKLGKSKLTWTKHVALVVGWG